MRRIYCDCCKREILDTEQIFCLEIKKGKDKEIVLDDMCTDCYEQIKYVIDHTEQY